MRCASWAVLDELTDEELMPSSLRRSGRLRNPSYFILNSRLGALDLRPSRAPESVNLPNDLELAQPLLPSGVLRRHSRAPGVPYFDDMLEEGSLT